MKRERNESRGARKMPADQPLAPDAARPAVCFITVEFHGLFRNGGIGTANTALALALAAEGFAVTVAIANADAAGPRLEIGDFATLKAHYAGLGICLDYVPPGAGLPRAFNDPALASWSVYEYLKSQNFDVVLFNDNGGQGYYTLLAKRMGVFAPAPHLVVVAHGPVDWVSELNAQEYFYMGLQTCFMEAQSAALADTLVSPSRYLLDWMSARGWVTPGQGLVVQNLVGAAPRPMPHIMHPVSELVFFGRQEIRKGIDLFCDALDELTVQGVDLTNVRVTFLGKFSMAGPLHSGVYIGERARQWRTQLRILTEYGQEEALAYLRAPGRLAVIPSRAENSPCVVAECLLQGILFLATDRGGTAELVAVEDREQCLFTPAPGDLAMRLAGCLAHGQRPGRLAVSQADVLAQWRALLRAMPDRTKSTAPEEHPATISVCLAGDTSPAFADCLAALQAQDVAPLEILVAPLVSMQAPAGTVLVPGLYPSRAAARNAAAAQARGSHLFFIEEQYATLAPEGIAVLLNAARGGADILTCMRAPEIDSQGGMPVLPLGGCLERGLMVNCFGDGAFAVRRASFGQGLPEDGPDRAAAWRFFIRNVATEAALALVPAPLLQWRYAHEMDDGAALVEERRCLVNDLADLPLRHVGRLLECAMQITQRRQTWLDTLAENFSGPAAEAVRQLRRVAPNSGQARKFFMTYCEGVGHAALALDYAAQNDPALIRSLVRPPPAPPPPKAVAPPPPKAAMASPAPVPAAVSAPPKAALPPAPPIKAAAPPPPVPASVPAPAPAPVKTVQTRNEVASKTLRLPMALLAQADVLTDSSGLDFAVFDHGPPVLLHPVAGRLSVARIPHMLPAGTAALHCVVSIGHERAHPIEFAVWAYPTGTGPDLPELPAPDVPCSGWLRVEVAYSRKELRLTFPAPCAGPMDVYIATNVPGQPNAYFCHAHWHEFRVPAPAAARETGIMPLVAVKEGLPG